MPAVTSQATNTHRASFYGRDRTSSSSSNQSSNSSNSNSNNTNNQQKSSSAASSFKSSSSSPHSKQHAAVVAAANAAQKRMLAKSNLPTSSASTSSLAKIHVEELKEEGRRNNLDEEEYQTEVIQHMHHMENETNACVDLMDAQPELRWFMRPYLVDFIVEIHQTFRLRPETLYLTMNIVDRYVSKRIVYKRHYQLVGCAALLIASKFEDSKDKVPTVAELSQMCCSAYDESAFTQMEGHVLSTIGWVLGFPTPEAWLRIQVAQKGVSAKVQSVARFFMEASLFHRDFIGLLPSHLTAGSLMLARFICSGGQAMETQEMDGEEVAVVESQETKQAAQTIDTFMRNGTSELSEILMKKYSFHHFANASTIVKEWYAKSAEVGARQDMAANVTGLLPAQSVSVQHLAQHDRTNKQQSSSSFSTPQQAGEEDDDEDLSMRSRCTTPSSMISTPSRMSGDGEDDEDYDEEEIEEEEDADMPVTPLSLNSLHDPLIAAGSSSSDQKQSLKVQPTTTTTKDSQHNRLQVKAIRPVLTISQQENKIASIA